MKATIEVNGQSREIEVWVSPSQITVWVTPDKYLSIDRACGLVTWESKMTRNHSRKVYIEEADEEITFDLGRYGTVRIPLPHTAD